MFGVGRNDSFDTIFETVTQKFAMRCTEIVLVDSVLNTFCIFSRVKLSLAMNFLCSSKVSLQGNHTTK